MFIKLLAVCKLWVIVYFSFTAMVLGSVRRTDGNQYKNYYVQFAELTVELKLLRSVRGTILLSGTLLKLIP